MPSNDILLPRLQPFGIAPGQLGFIRRNQNSVYSCTVDGLRRIIRVSTERHRTHAEIDAELAWIRLLAEKGLNLCQPVPATDGRLAVGLRQDGKDFVCACFEHAPGGPVPSPADDGVHTLLGKTVGHMHWPAREGNLSGMRFSTAPIGPTPGVLKEYFATAKHRLSPEFESVIATLGDSGRKDCSHPGELRAHPRPRPFPSTAVRIRMS